jgi:predicted CoA-binding protein
MNDDQQSTIRHILTTYHTVAVIGFSDRDRRPLSTPRLT